jgi:hypothetical protein
MVTAMDAGSYTGDGSSTKFPSGQALYLIVTSRYLKKIRLNTSCEFDILCKVSFALNVDVMVHDRNADHHLIRFQAPRNHELRSNSLVVPVAVVRDYSCPLVIVSKHSNLQDGISSLHQTFAPDLFSARPYHGPSR